MSILGFLICLFRGHFYRPAYEYRYRARSESPRARHTARRYRYKCDCCGALTKWMTHKQHEAFVLKFNPTWGARGSDSQGRRNTA